MAYRTFEIICELSQRDLVIFWKYQKRNAGKYFEDLITKKTFKELVNSKSV